MEGRDDLARPEGLSRRGAKAYGVIRRFLKAYMYEYTGGCRAFYSPQEWKERGEEYGTDSVLVVVHDGGDLAYVFNMARASSNVFEAVNEALSRAGFHLEPCTGWYGAIYDDR